MIAHYSGLQEQLGIVSWGQGCGLPGYPGVYTDIGFYIDWLSKNTARHVN